MRIVIVRGPHKGAVLIDEISGPFFRFYEPDRRSPLRRYADRIRGREPELAPPVLYRVFARAATDDERGEMYAAEWCEEHDAFRDRCPHTPPTPTRVWARFGPRRDQTKLEAGAPGTRDSKWHLLSNDRQVAEPWLTVCELIVYGPIIEEYRNAVLTPIGAPMCRGCKSFAGLRERILRGVEGA
ncbi:MAG TPA: hypothetical protein VGR85_15665 [Candidatus Limnocylindria bacterium]|jgi:hypothetical protein|nr:hypothetical protein [Candidatus Limnocylindria bacterium]